MLENTTLENTPDGGLPSTDLLADLKRLLDSAVREYETAIMRKPTDEDEIRRCVDRCASARQKFNAANAQVDREREDALVNAIINEIRFSWEEQP
jgi:hypothetical protein